VFNFSLEENTPKKFIVHVFLKKGSQIYSGTLISAGKEKGSSDLFWRCCLEILSSFDLYHQERKETTVINL
jgi:hypothetical protein